MGSKASTSAKRTHSVRNDQLVTYLCDTLKYVKAHKNVTLSLPEPLLRKFRVYAAFRNRSMTNLMTEAIQTLMEREEQQESAKRRFLKRIMSAPDRGTGGKIRWTREELHER
jgi:predicted transcriptional regulator